MIDFGLGKLRLWSAAAACAALFMTQAAGAQPAAFTLNDVMQAPYPYDMVAAPTGSAVAWVFDAKGCRNIWVADPSHGAKARQITPYTGDDGFNIRELAWSPDTKSIAFTRGENLWDETPANVNNSPQGPMPKEVWMVATAGGVPHKVGAGDSPSFSPDGSRLLFRRQEKNSDGGRERRWRRAAIAHRSGNCGLADLGAGRQAPGVREPSRQPLADRCLRFR